MTNCCICICVLCFISMSLWKGYVFHRVKKTFALYTNHVQTSIGVS